jgi:perosamine synthetase
MKIPIAEPIIGKEELKNVVEAVESGWISSKGRFIEEFERKFAKYCGVDYGIATSNGTTALHLALAALGIKKGDEVIVPALTFVATANAVTYCNAKPVFVDSHPDYWCIDPRQVERKITKNTKAIIPVHLYGHPCDMDWIMDIAEDHDLYVVEDAAEAHGAEYKGSKVGSFGDVSCFSFYGNKIITTGEGGMCLTNNEELAEKMRLLRDHGMSKERKYWHEFIGFNYRMTNLQAAIGVAQLKKIENIIERKRLIAKLYKTELIELEKKGIVRLQMEMKWAKSVFWLYCVVLGKGAKHNRDEIMKELESKGITTRPIFYPLTDLPPYSSSYGLNDYKIAKKISYNGICLPSYFKLNKDTIITIAKILKNSLMRR